MDMTILVKSIILTAALIIAKVLMKQKQRIMDYIIYFFLVLLSYFLFSFESAQSSESFEKNETQFNIVDYSDFGIFMQAPKNFIPNAQAEIAKLSAFNFEIALTHQQRKTFVEKIEFHESNARRTFRDAKNKCWWLPDSDDREKARACFTTLMAGASPGTPMSRIVCSLVVALTNYGLACMDEWDYIHNKLHWSQYHYEMKEFYENCLING